MDEILGQAAESAVIREISWQDIEKAAANNKNLPSAATLHDRWCLDILRGLMGQYKENKLTREAAGKEKARIHAAWERQRQTEKADFDLAKWHHDLRKEIEGAVIQYQKERTLENADKLIAVIDGRLAF